MPLIEPSHLSEAVCDVCGLREKGHTEEFLALGWSSMQRTRQGPLDEPLLVCGDCLYIRRFGEAVNESLYHRKREILAKWAEIEAEEG